MGMEATVYTPANSTAYSGLKADEYYSLHLSKSFQKYNCLGGFLFVQGDHYNLILPNCQFIVSISLCKLSTPCRRAAAGKIWDLKLYQGGINMYTEDCESLSTRRVFIATKLTARQGGGVVSLARLPTSICRLQRYVTLRVGGGFPGPRSPANLQLYLDTPSNLLTVVAVQQYNNTPP